MKHVSFKRRALLAILVLAALVIAATVFAEAEGATESNPFTNSFWALVPPIVAIGLALITKEVYSSLFIGILVGACFYAKFNFEGIMNHLFIHGLVGTALSDSYNVGILVFLVILGVMVALMNKSGGAAAFGKWSAQKIKGRTAA